MAAIERRNELAEYDVSYCVYGSFRESDGDEGFRDTRWLNLSELIAAFELETLQQHIVAYEQTFFTFREQTFQLLREQQARLSADSTIPRVAEEADGVEVSM